MKKIAYLTRHGETVNNLKNVFQGLSDSPLTNLGVRQAEQLRDYFKENNIGFDHAYSSVLGRAIATLDILTEGKVESKHLEGLNERYYGDLEGKSHDVKRYPGFDEEHGCETYPMTSKRVSECMINIMEEKDNQNVLIVTHGGALRSFVNLWENDYNLEMAYVPNLALYIMEYEDKKFCCKKIVYQDFSKLER